jgi:Inner membrane protein YgaP-like, transmembrane domain
MKRNIGLTDRAIRIVAGFALLSLVFMLEGNARWWGLVGILPLATGLVGWSALYLPFGIDTCGTERDGVHLSTKARTTSAVSSPP